MKINKNIKHREKILKIAPCPENYFYKFLDKTLGVSGIQENKPWKYEESLINSYIKLDRSTYNDIDMNLDLPAGTLYSAGINRRITNRIGLTYIQCWIKPYKFSPKTCIYIYYTGQGVRGFLPIMGNTVNPWSITTGKSYPLNSKMITKELRSGTHDLTNNAIFLNNEIFGSKKIVKPKLLKDILTRDLIEPDFDLCEADFKACLVFDLL